MQGEVVQRPLHEKDIQVAPLRFADASQYRDIYATMLRLEAAEDRRKTESQKHHVSVRWEVGINNKRQVFIKLPTGTSELRLSVGDEIRLRYVGVSHKPWSSEGKFLSTI